MQLIKLSATDSTNTYLKALAAKNNLQDFTVVSTRNQTSGRGQLEAKWESEGGNNLAFSILKKHVDLTVNQAFLISISVSLAILDGLEQLRIPNLSIKWPNDILSGDYKIGGVLIENMISGSRIRGSVIGFGLNVNQDSFENIPHAASLKEIVGHSFDLDEVLNVLIENMNKQLMKPMGALKEELFEAYHAKLYRIGRVSKFRMKNGEVVRGVIKGIAYSGKLQVRMQNENVQEFGLKEIQLLY